MVVDGAAVQRGMEVYGQDGAKIGTVAAVHPIGQMLLGQEHIPPRGVVSDAGVVGEEVPINEAHERKEVMIEGYVRVERGGILGLAPTQLYIPLDVVSDIAYGKRLTLDCTKDACCHLYREKPLALDADTGESH